MAQLFTPLRARLNLACTPDRLIITRRAGTGSTRLTRERGAVRICVGSDAGIDDAAHALGIDRLMSRGWPDSSDASDTIRAWICDELLWAGAAAWAASQGADPLDVIRPRLGPLLGVISTLDPEAPVDGLRYALQGWMMVAPLREEDRRAAVAQIRHANPLIGDAVDECVQMIGSLPDDPTGARQMMEWMATRLGAPAMPETD